MRRLGGAPRRSPPGFTLIELVVVLAIVAMLSALVLPLVGRSAQGLQLRSEAGRLAALLREARLRAVTQRRPMRVELDPGQHAAALVADGADQPLRRLTFPEEFRLSVAAGSESVPFSSRGVARQTRWLIESPSGRQLAITVEAVTGRVVVRPEGGP